MIFNEDLRLTYQVNDIKINSESLSKGERKKRQIIEAAIECLASLGIENTTFEAIANKIGTRRAHVAYHFNDKNIIFNEAILYILQTYSIYLDDYLKKAQKHSKSKQKSNETYITFYVKGAFKWAKDNPAHISVFLLFYYLSSIKNEYLDLNSMIRKEGLERLKYILGVKMNYHLEPEILNQTSSFIQNILSAKMIELFTTNYQKNLNAEKEAIEMIEMVLNSVKT